MKAREWGMRLFFSVAGRIVYRSDTHTDWLYERIQRPQSIYIASRNLLNYYLGVPRVHGILGLVVEPVFGCNLACRYCWGSMPPELRNSRPHLMDWELFRKIVDQAPHSAESITFASLGEPLLHPRIADMIEYVAHAGLRPIMYSNCTLLKGDTLSRIANVPLSVLNVSVEPDVETFREYRGVELDTILSNVEEFVANKLPETEVKLSVVVHEGNVDKLNVLLREWGHIVRHVKYHARVVYTLESTASPTACLEVSRGALNILTSGEVSPCCVDVHGALAIGNLNNQDFEGILTGSCYRDLLQRFVENHAPDRCRQCSEFATRGLAIKAPKHHRAD